MVALQDLSAADLAAAADANFVAHAGWVQQQTPDMRVVDATDLVLVDSGLPCDTFNLVGRARLAPDTASERIRWAVDYFAGARRPFSWWLGPGDQPPELGDLLSAAGLQRAETELAMAADLTSLRAGALSPERLQIRRARTPAEIRHFADALSSTPRDPQVVRFYDLAAPALLADDSPLWLYVGYLGEVPVATAELAVAGGVVGLYNISTLEDYRRRGFGSALTLRPLLDARSLGYRAAVLQAASAGVSMYTRIGFEPFGRITEYKPVSSGEGAGT